MARWNIFVKTIIIWRLWSFLNFPAFELIAPKKPNYVIFWNLTLSIPPIFRYLPGGPGWDEFDMSSDVIRHTASAPGPYAESSFLKVGLQKSLMTDLNDCPRGQSFRSDHIWRHVEFISTWPTGFVLCRSKGATRFFSFSDYSITKFVSRHLPMTW